MGRQASSCPGEMVVVVWLVGSLWVAYLSIGNVVDDFGGYRFL